MQDDNYAKLLAHLLDDELNEEQGDELLAYLEQNPDKLEDVTRHLELWDLYTQSVCSERSAERFLDSWETRLGAAEDADQFVHDLEARLVHDTESDQERVQEIERRAQQELRKFLAERRPLSPSRRTHRRHEWNVGERARDGLERLCDLMGTGFKVVKVLAVCLAIALAIPTTIRYIQAKRVVAVLHDSVDARWTNPPEQTALRRGRLELQEGFAQITFKSGACATLQAPCVVELESPCQLFLESGSLAVRMAEPYQNFLVRTHSSTIEDLGTEFGVIIKQQGQTETQVYEGRVQLAQGSRKKRQGPKQILTQGQAAGVNSDGQIIQCTFDARRFTRDLPEFRAFGIPGRRLDLADVLMGGNGFGTGDTNKIMDLRTGMINQRQYGSVNPITAGKINTVVHSSSPVDFLFLPDGGDGPVQISSAGHTFDQCPDTDGYTYPYVTDSALIRTDPGSVATQVLNGKDYGTRVDPVISMHANAGITFDIQAIQAMSPGRQIRRFSAVCGISETAGTAMLRESGLPALQKADFWVLVDGRVRFQRKGVQVHTGGIPLDVELDAQDRFLTLMVTDGGDNHGYDWGVFAEPALKFE